MAIGQFSSSLDVVVGSAYPQKETHFQTIAVSSIDDPSLILSLSKPFEVSKRNWRFGISYNQQIIDQFYFKIGARFAHYTYKATTENHRNRINTPTDTEPQLPSSDTTGVNFIQNPIPFDDVRVTKNHFSFLEIPIMWRYQFNHKKWSPFIELGLSPTVLIGQDRLYIYRKLRLATNLSVGIHYTPLEHLQFFVQPIFRYHLTKLNGNLSFGNDIHSYGIEFGVRKKL